MPTPTPARLVETLTKATEAHRATHHPAKHRLAEARRKAAEDAAAARARAAEVTDGG